MSKIDCELQTFNYETALQFFLEKFHSVTGFIYVLDRTFREVKNQEKEYEQMRWEGKISIVRMKTNAEIFQEECERFKFDRRMEE